MILNFIKKQTTKCKLQKQANYLKNNIILCNNELNNLIVFNAMASDIMYTQSLRANFITQYNNTIKTLQSI